MNYVHLPKYDEHIENSNDLKIITLDEFSRIIDRFPFGSSFYIPLQIAFHTGMRGGEIAALTWDNIDLENGFIDVKYTLINILNTHKEWQNNNKEKYNQWYKQSKFVCTKENGEHITTNTYKYLSRVVNYELQINFSMHSLRHTHVTLLLENGANFKDIQKRLGYSKLSTTLDTYSHVTKRMKNETVNIFENIAKKLPPS